MRYDQKENLIRITVRELVSLARQQEDGALPPEEDGEEGVFSAKLPSPAVTLTATVGGETDMGGLLLRITGEAAVEGETLTLAYRVKGDPSRPAPSLLRQARGEGFCTAALLLRQEILPQVRIRLLFRSPSFPEPWEYTETPALDRIERFLRKLIRSVRALSESELDRVVRRLPTLRSVRFPYPSVREGQGELIAAAYRAIRRGERLYASAPTGTGKTASVLFPAIRALGEGCCDKIFYFTSKNTTADAAADAIRRFHRAGAELRALRLIAKERVCRHKLYCRGKTEERCPLSRRAERRMDEARAELIGIARPVMDMETVREVGERYKLCPNELALHYAMECDIIICDYNYLFDPKVSLHRFFSEKGRWCFLIDEAHNLVERSRELYSAELTLSFFERLRPLLENTPSLTALLDHTVEEISGILSPLLADSLLPDGEGVLRGFYSCREIPPGLPEAVSDLLFAIDGALAEQDISRKQLLTHRDAYYGLKELSDRLALYADGYTSFLYQEGEELRYRALCIDPSAILASRLSLGRSAVLFSATFTPVDYYRAVLGGTETSDTLELPSPFDPSRLCVAILDRITTRYSERAASLTAIARAILTAVRAKPGNYLVFTPSFAYLTALADEVSRLAPRLPTVRQAPHMTPSDRRAFLERFSEENRSALIGFSVLGGIFSEGIDLTGKRLIGSIIVGVALPTPTPEQEAIRAYYDDTREMGREFAYVYPGMNRVLQAAGRVIRREDDRGIVLLIDDRFSDPVYRELIPLHWRGLKYVGDLTSLDVLLRRFWTPPAP